MANRWGNNGNSNRLYFLGLQNHFRWWLQPWNSKTLAPWKESYDEPRQHAKKQRHYLVNKGPSSQGYGFSSSHLWRWDLDCIESWAPKNWCIWTVVLEKTLESPLNCKVKPVHMKGNQSWIFIGRTGAEAETPVLWPPDSKSWLIGKDPDAGNDWRQEKKGTTEDEMVGWHHWHNEHEFEQALELMMDTEAWRAAVHRVAVRHDWEAALNWCEFIEYKKHPMLMVLSTSFILFLVFSGIWEWNFIFEF